MQKEQPGQSDDFPFPADCIICPFARSQTNDQIVQPLFLLCLDTDSYCLSDLSPGYIRQNRITGRVSADSPITCWKLQSRAWRAGCVFLFFWSYVQNSFLVRSLSWHGGTFRVAHTDSWGRGGPPRLLHSGGVASWHQTNTHTVWQLWSKGTNNVTASRAPRQPARPAGSKWIWFFRLLKGLDSARAAGQM